MKTKKAYKPTIKDMISLERNGVPKISPNGKKIAFSIQKTNWNKNRYERSCYIYDVSSKKLSQLTRGANVKQYEWFNDQTLIVLKAEFQAGGSKNQLWVYEDLIGDSWQLTDHPEGVQSFNLFGEGVVFLANDSKRSEKKSRKELFGSITYFEKEASASALYYTNVEKMSVYLKQKIKPKDELSGLVEPVVDLSVLLDKPRKIRSIYPSPKNDKIFLNCWPRDDLIYAHETTVHMLTLDPDTALENYLKMQTPEESKDEESENGKAEQEEEEDYSYLGNHLQLALPKGAYISAVSPDGLKVLVGYKERDQMYYTQADLFLLDLKEHDNILTIEEKLVTKLEKLTEKLDQVIYRVKWVKAGIFAGYIDHVSAKIALLKDGKIEEIDTGDYYSTLNFDVSPKGHLVLALYTEKARSELFLSKNPLAKTGPEFKKITSNSNEEIANWEIGSIEVIRWKSKDGTEIEGILRKPANFDPSKKYPLLFVVHGGPASYSGNFLIDYGDCVYYPSVQLAAKDILVLKPNYRGSVGRGQAFLELNKDNLGVGDLWDLEGAIDYLDKQGILDNSKIGCAGWSQGGYISAFASLHSDKFSAASVGAGISDWYTYHISNDIPQFTIHYLSGSPFRDRKLYEKTAPISKIKEAKTPTLIQHGAKDNRVPISNAMELYRGLQEMGVHVELFVFPEMAHPITKPRENYAVMYQNLSWFSHYLLGEELDLLPEKSEK